MTRFGTLDVTGGDTAAAARSLAELLLKKNVVAGVLIQKPVTAGGNAPPVLITDPALLSNADPFYPVMPVNAGEVVARMTAVAPAERSLAVFLRPCESRALVELVKLRQASLDNVLIVGMDCPGTVDLESFAQGGSSDSSLASRLDGSQDLRRACTACADPSPETADLVIALFGTRPSEALLVEGRTKRGEEVLDAIGLAPSPAPPSRGDALAAERKKRRAVREADQPGFLETVQGSDGVLAFFAKCIKCQNCRKVCPVCYCKECFFDSPTFEMEAEKYLNWAGAKGAYRLPGDTLLFHLTRLTHMAASCVSCGMCSQACPSGIDVGALFSAVGDQVQSTFEYVPGQDLEAEIPFTTFREDELKTFG